MADVRSHKYTSTTLQRAPVCLVAHVHVADAIATQAASVWFSFTVMTDVSTVKFIYQRTMRSYESSRYCHDVRPSVCK